MLLPDAIVLPGVWLGLAAGYFGLLTSLESSFLGAAAGYLSFAVPAWVYSKIRGRIGMGGGDYKLMALLGAWLGWQMLPVIFIISTVSAAILGLAVARLRGEQIPFGPFIIVAGLLALFFGQDLYLWYAHANGIHIGAEFFE
jgi:leader peptidase (prepilin peptidase)/N-methyltransferase